MVPAVNFLFVMFERGPLDEGISGTPLVSIAFSFISWK